MKRFVYIGVYHPYNPTFPFATYGFSFRFAFFRTRSNINHHKYDRFGKFRDQECQDSVKNIKSCTTLPYKLTIYSLDSTILLLRFGWLPLTTLGLLEGKTLNVPL